MKLLFIGTEEIPRRLRAQLEHAGLIEAVQCADETSALEALHSAEPGFESRQSRASSSTVRARKVSGRAGPQASPHNSSIRPSGFIPCLRSREIPVRLVIGRLQATAGMGDSASLRPVAAPEQDKGSNRFKFKRSRMGRPLPPQAHIPACIRPPQRRSHVADGRLSRHQGTRLPWLPSPRRPPHGSSRHRRPMQPGDPRQDLSKHPSRHRDLRHLERDIAAVADHLRADLDQLLPERGQRPVLYFLRYVRLLLWVQAV